MLPLLILLAKPPTAVLAAAATLAYLTLLAVVALVATFHTDRDHRADAHRVLVALLAVLLRHPRGQQRRPAEQTQTSGSPG
jgi:hypothetical protein